MTPRVSTLVRSVTVIAMCLCATPVHAQFEREAGASPRQDLPSSVDVLVGTQAILHAVDMFTTAYDLQLSETRARGILCSRRFPGVR